MKRQKGDADQIFIMIVILVIVISLGVGADAMSCQKAWAKSGLKTSWGFFQGCLVEVEPGRWIPDNRVREMDIKPQKK